MSENSKIDKTFHDIVKNRAIGRYLGLKNQQAAVKEVMHEQGIIEDPSKMKGYRVDKFLRALDKKIGVGYEARKSFRFAFGAKKPETQTIKKDPISEKKEVNMHSVYDEIRNEGKNNMARITGNDLGGEKISPYSGATNPARFTISNKNLYGAKGLVVDSGDEHDRDVRSAIERIKS